MKNRLGSRRGNALVEFALASLVLIPLFVGTFQFGYVFYVYNLLCTQTRAAARYASLKTFTCSNSTKITNWKTSVKNMMRFGNPDGTGTVIEPGLDANEIDVQIKDASGNDADDTHVPAYVTVTTVNYGVNAIVTTFNFNNKPFVKFPYAGRYAPEE